MDDRQIERVEKSITDFYSTIQQCLKFRITPWGEYDSRRMRIDGLSDQLVHAANLAVEVEELLVGMLIVQQHIHMLWDEAEAEHLQSISHLPDQRYVSKEAKMSALIAEENDLYQLRRRIDACVEAGKRAVDRLELMNSTASRAVGFAQ